MWVYVHVWVDGTAIKQHVGGFSSATLSRFSLWDLLSVCSFALHRFFPHRFPNQADLSGTGTAVGPATTVVAFQLPIILLKMFKFSFICLGVCPSPCWLFFHHRCHPSEGLPQQIRSEEPGPPHLIRFSYPPLFFYSIFHKNPNQSATFSTQPHPLRILGGLCTFFRRNFGMGEFFL